ERLLERLTPYQNGHRVPAVLAEALLPGPESGDGGGAPLPADELNGLVTALGFTMQPQVHPSLRPAAEHYLARHFGPRGDQGHHWFRRERLASLGLPGGVPQRLASLSRNATARRMVRRARALKKAVRG